MNYFSINFFDSAYSSNPGQYISRRWREPWRRLQYGGQSWVHTLRRSPLVWAEEQRSLPARSTRLILLVILCSCSSSSTNSVWHTHTHTKTSQLVERHIWSDESWSYTQNNVDTHTHDCTLVWVITRVKTEWDLELLSFMPVAAVALCLLPSSSQPYEQSGIIFYDSQWIELEL